MNFMRTKLWVSVFLLLAILPGARPTSRKLPHDAYVWQRRWTPAVGAALEQSSDVIRAWRVLIAELNPYGHWSLPVVDSSVLKNSQRPIVLVIRIDGRGISRDEGQTLADIDKLVERWRHTGLQIAGLEIDHDCGVTQLRAYTRFVVRLRARLNRPVALSITALPAWLPSPAVDELFAKVDEIVLQVHAVRSPRVGLFDRELARDWIWELSRRTSKPFRVALPAYGARVIWQNGGGLLAVESEAPLLEAADSAVELMAAPRDVSALLRDLEYSPPPNLSGVVWFRLPTAGDRRAWSLETWRAVILARPLRTHIEAIVQPSDTPGMNSLVLANTGDVDAELPQIVDLPAACTVGDGVNGFVLGSTDRGIKLQRSHVGFLRAHYHQVIGWMRCAPSSESVHVQQ